MSSSRILKTLCVSAIILEVLTCSMFHANAATINVPLDYPTIQAGINAAQDGDTVLVGPGTYQEDVDFLSKAISVVSAQGCAATVIDGNKTGPVVTIFNGPGLSSASQLLEGFTIRDGNSAAGLGGGVEVRSSSPNILGNIFESNYYYFGVAINVVYSSSPVIEQNIFQNNSCSGQPGNAVVYSDGSSSPLIIDNIFLNNQCTAICVFNGGGCEIQVSNNTIVGNSGGIQIENLAYLSSLPSLFKNNIIVDNSIGLDIPCYFDNPNWANNLVYGNDTNYSGVSDQTGINGNISANPLFLDPANNDYHLSLGSPAIGAGEKTGLSLPATDFDGNPRVVNNKVDMGAYEFNPEAALQVFFQADKISGPAPLSVQFTSRATKPVTKYLWNFGDGSTGTKANPVHAFSPGVYTVSLKVSGKGGTATETRDNLIAPQIALTASAGLGGTISPSGVTTVNQGSSVTYTAAANPNYQLTALMIDGENVGNQSTYTFSNIEACHTITAVFACNFDYFGMQAANSEESVFIYPGGSMTQTDDISLDMTSFTQPSYIDLLSVGGSISKNWYQVCSNGLFLKQMQSSGTTFTFSPALPYIETPLAPGAHWKATSTVSSHGASGKATITAKVSSINFASVQAGTFMVWPIEYTLNISGRAGTLSTSWTDYFSPYFGAVMTDPWNSSMSQIQLTNFAVGGGTVTTPPPVVYGIDPTAAPCGSTLWIRGEQFGDSQGSSKVRIGSVDIECAPEDWSHNSIQCTVPDTAVSGAVTIVTDTWTSLNDSVVYTVTLPVEITSIIPSSGKPGSTVKIFGANFGTAPGQLLFGSWYLKITQWTNNSITFTVPANTPPYTDSILGILPGGQQVDMGNFEVVK